LNERAYRYARQLIGEGRYVLDDRDEWSEHQASTQRENEFIAAHLHGSLDALRSPTHH